MCILLVKKCHYYIKKMPFFVNQTLHLSTVLATWLVLNHRYLYCLMPEKKYLMKESLAFTILHMNLYEKEIKMGSTMLRPQTFQLNVLQGFCYQSRKRRTEEILEDLKRLKKWNGNGELFELLCLLNVSVLLCTRWWQ